MARNANFDANLARLFDEYAKADPLGSVAHAAKLANVKHQQSAQEALASGRYDRRTEALDNAAYSSFDAMNDIQKAMDAAGVSVADLKGQDDMRMDLGVGNTLYGNRIDHGTGTTAGQFHLRGAQPDTGTIGQYAVGPQRSADVPEMALGTALNIVGGVAGMPIASALGAGVGASRGEGDFLDALQAAGTSLLTSGAGGMLGDYANSYTQALSDGAQIVGDAERTASIWDAIGALEGIDRNVVGDSRIPTDVQGPGGAWDTVVMDTPSGPRLDIPQDDGGASSASSGGGGDTPQIDYEWVLTGEPSKNTVPEAPAEAEVVYEGEDEHPWTYQGGGIITHSDGTIKILSHDEREGLVKGEKYSSGTGQGDEVQEEEEDILDWLGGLLNDDIIADAPQGGDGTGDIPSVGTGDGTGVGDGPGSGGGSGSGGGGVGTIPVIPGIIPGVNPGTGTGTDPGPGSGSGNPGLQAGAGGGMLSNQMSPEEASLLPLVAMPWLRRYYKGRR